MITSRTSWAFKAVLNALNGTLKAPAGESQTSVNRGDSGHQKSQTPSRAAETHVGSTLPLIKGL